MIGIPSTADRIPYSIGGNYSSTELTSFARDNIINAASANDLSTALGYIVGPVSTANRLVKVNASNSVEETALILDLSSNLSGVNDLSVGGDITLTGDLDSITPTMRTQLANINSTTISSTQWGYLGALDQSLTTTDTPTFSGLNASSAKITNLLDPTNAQDASTKSYVDTVASTGAPPLSSANIATAAVLPNSPAYASPAETITSTGGPGSLTIDTLTASVADRILVKDQADDRENGIYDVTDDGASPGPNWVLTRSSDFDQTAMPVVSGSSIFVEIQSGASNSGSSWSLQTTVNNVDPLTDSVSWVQIGATAALTAGLGIDATQLSGGTIGTDVSARLKYTVNTLDLNTVTVPYGGTGLTTLTSGNVLVGNGTSAVTITKAAPSGDFVGTSDSQTLTTKTITDSSNNVTARSLFSNSGSNTVSTYAAANPSSGQVLTATGTTTATWQTPSSGSGFAPDRTLFVYQSAPDVTPNWSSVAAAIADASTLTPTAADPVMVLIYPGTYSEVTPITLPPYVVLSGQTSTSTTVIIRPVAPAAVGAVIIVQGNCRIYGLIIDGDDGAGGFSTFGVISNVGTIGSIDTLNSCVVRNCSTSGIKVTGNGAQYSKIIILENVSVQVTTSFPFVMTNGLEAELGGLISGLDVNSTGFLSGGAVLTNAINVHDEFSFADLNVVQFSSATNGIVCGGGVNTSISQDDYPRVRIISAKLGFITGTALSMTEKSNVNLADIIIDDNTGTAFFANQQHITIVNPALPANPNLLEVKYIQLRLDRVSTIGGAADNPPNILGTFVNIVPQKLQLVNNGEFIVGVAGNGSRFIAGEGDVYASSMMVLSDDGGVFTDVTDNIKLAPFVPIDVDIATTGSIDLASAPATIDGISPSSGSSTVLVKDGSTANPGSSSVDNGVYVWNGTGSAMTRATTFAAGDNFTHETYFVIDTGTINYGGVWQLDIDVTVGTTAFSLDARSIPVFPTTFADDDALYIGNSLPLIFPGIKLGFTKPITLSSGSVTDAVTWEFWDGSSWAKLCLLSTLSDSPYTAFANQTLAIDQTIISPNSADFHYRFGDIDTWATTTIDGTLAYWVRCRLVDSSVVTQNPILEFVNLHTNSTEIDADGYLEYFGNARPKKKISITTNQMFEPNGGGFNNPSGQRIVPTGTNIISAQLIQGQFGNNTSNQYALSYGLEMPSELDTSFFVELKFKYSTQGGTGDLAVRANYGFITDGDIIGTPGGTPDIAGKTTGLIASPVPSGSSGITGSHTFSLNLTDFNADTDTLWFTIIRENDNVLDTYGSNIYVSHCVLIFRTWASGGY